MDTRLHPECAGARALEARHREQTELLVGDPHSPLADVVRHTQQRQIDAHRAACAFCGRPDTRCASCGFDTARERHGWMCARASERWRDALPWNWRARRAPARDRTGAPAGDRTRAVTRPHTPAATAPPPGRPFGIGPAPRSVPITRAAPPRSRLVKACAALGVREGASAKEIHAAYHARAQQYHPDKVAHLAPEFRDVAERRMMEINEAYDALKRLA